MKWLHTSFLCFIMPLLATFAVAADFPILEVASASTPAQITAAKLAFDNGSIVAMKGGTLESFEALLNVSMPRSSSRHRQPPPCVQAARKLPSGRVRKFMRLSRPFSPDDAASCASAFTRWTALQSSLTDTAIPNWTAVEDLSLDSAWTTSTGNTISFDMTTYRANTIDSAWDYYLVLTTATVVRGSNNLINIGIYSLQNFADYGQGVRAAVYGYGPIANTTSLSVGQGISFDQNSSGVYTAQVPSKPEVVNTLPNSGLAWGFLGLQPNAAAFTQQTATVYQVPNKTPRLTIATAAWFNSDPQNNFILVPIPAPQVLLPQLTFAMQGVRSSFDVTVSPYLQTQLASVPQWMPTSTIQFTDANGNVTVDPPANSPSFNISFFVPNPPSCITDGSCSPAGNITLQTQPLFAAAQTKPSNITPATIELVPNSPTAGVLIAGGQDWSGNILKTADVWNSQTGTITAVQSQMVEARSQHTSTLVAQSSTCQAANANCPAIGQVLIAGGIGANGQALSSTEFFNPNTAQFTAGPSMTSPHAGAVAVQLQDGRILIMGGLDQTNSATSIADIYNPLTNTFSSTPMALTMPRWNFAANVLQDGSVLVQGGSNGPSQYLGPATSSAEKLDNCGSGFYPLSTGPVVPRQALSTALLKNGQLLIAGGYNGNTNGGGPLTDVELFTPSSESFSQLSATLATGRRASALVPLENGDALLVGGDNLANVSNVYNPSSMAFTDSSYTTMAENRDFPKAVRLEGIGTADKGKVLVAGGVIPDTGSSNGQLVELYDPTTNTWTAVGNMSASRRLNTTTLFGRYAGSLPATFGCQ